MCSMTGYNEQSPLKTGGHRKFIRVKYTKWPSLNVHNDFFSPNTLLQYYSSPHIQSRRINAKLIVRNSLSKPVFGLSYMIKRCGSMQQIWGFAIQIHWKGNGLRKDDDLCNRFTDRITSAALRLSMIKRDIKLITGH